MKEVADYLRVHPTTIYRLLKKRQIPAFKVGSDWRFSLESIDGWRSSAGRADTNEGSKRGRRGLLLNGYEA